MRAMLRPTLRRPRDMRPTKIPSVEVALHSTGSMDYIGSNHANVVLLRPNANIGEPFDRMTARRVIDQYRAGTRPEGVIVALLANAGLHP